MLAFQSLKAKLKDLWLAYMQPTISTVNWKYVGFFSAGSVAAFIASYAVSYKLSGSENHKQFLFAIYLKYNAQRYTNSTSSWRLSKYVRIRPSPELCALDAFYFNFIRANLDPIKREQYKNKPLRDRIVEFKSMSSSKHFYDINPTLLPFKTRSAIAACVQEMYINGFRSLKINYPGTDDITVHKKEGVNVVLAFHGGSNCGGAPEHMRAYCVLLSRLTDATCYSVGYGLAPDYIMPAMVEHVIDAYKYILQQYAERSIKVNKILLCGHSGGGGIVVLALQSMATSSIQRYPTGAIILSANLDRSMASETFVTNHATDAAVDKELFHDMEHMVVGNVSMDGVWKTESDRVSMKDPRLSPLFGSVKGLCDLYVYVGLTECLLGEHQQFIEKCKANQVKVEHEFHPCLPHNGPLMCDMVLEARDSVVRIAQWVNRL